VGDARTLVELALGSFEERPAEAERYRAADEGEAQVEQARSPGNGTPDEPAGALDDLGGGFGGGPARDLLDRRPGRLGFKAPPRPATALPPGWLDDEVADVAGVTAQAVKQAPVEDYPTTDPGRDDHGEKVRHFATRTRPGLPEGERLGIVVDEDRERAEQRQGLET
jgi:hypothetical protein